MSQTLADSLRLKNQECEENKVPVRVMMPPSLQLKPNASGYIVGFSFDEAVIDKAVTQVKMLCESRRIPMDAQYHGGEKVDVVTSRYSLDKLNDVLSMDVMVHVLNNF